MKNKLRIISVLLLILFLYMGLGYRLFHLQIKCHARFDKMAKNNYSVQETKISPVRGEIVDRNGMIVAVNNHTYSVGFNFSYDKWDKELSTAVKKILGKKMQLDIKDARGFQWLARHISPSIAGQFAEYTKKGIVLVKENSRYYPHSPVASKVIGCVGTDNQGLSGIEYNFDKQLKNNGQKKKIIRDARGRLVQLSTSYEDPSENVASIQITLDMNLQYITERELKKGYVKYKPKFALAVMQDPNTGEILAMAEYPSYDNNKGVPDSFSGLKNRAVSYIFEPGSTFKIVTAAAALQEKLVREGEVIYCENGEFEVGGFPIRDFEPHDKLNFTDCMVHSSNIALSKVGARLGDKLLFKYARDFGFGNFSGIRLPGETRGILRKPDRWSGTSLSRISFGQEIGVTATQLVGAFSAIANGGILYEPNVIKNIRFPGSFREFKPLMIRRVVDESTALRLRNILKEVVKRGSGVQAQVGGYSVAGKTGTAQKYNPETDSYAEDKYVALFGGFLPADDPKISLVVMFDEPDVDFYWGGYVAAPVFAEISRAALNYMNIPPEAAEE